jgi:hypothetical protein
VEKVNKGAVASAEDEVSAHCVGGRSTACMYLCMHIARRVIDLQLQYHADGSTTLQSNQGQKQLAWACTTVPCL